MVKGVFGRLIGTAPVAALGLVLLQAFPVSAADPLAPEPPARSLKETIIENNVAVSRWFDGAAEGLDVFLTGERLTSKRNKTQVIIENSTTSNEGEAPNNTTSLNVNLRLPNFEEYWQLKFTSYDEQEESRGVERNYLRQSQREKRYGATLGFFRKLGRVKVAFQPRVLFIGAPQLSQSLSFESQAKVDGFEVSPKVELYADPKKGTGSFQRLNFSFLLSKIYSLALINDGDYQEKSHLYSVNNGFSIGQSVGPRAGLAYSLIFNSVNQPNYRLNNYDASISWTQVIYRNIFDFQLTPHVNFAEQWHFKGRAGAILNLRVYF